jgi:hypothetical protein
MATLKQIRNLPATIPGHPLLQEAVQQSPVMYRSLAFNSSEASGATLQLIELPENCVLVDVKLHVNTAFDASGTSDAATAVLTVPSDTGTVAIYDAANAGLQVTGSKANTGGLFPYPLPTGGFVTLSYTPGSTTAGQLQVYVEVAQFADRMG